MMNLIIPINGIKGEIMKKSLFLVVLLVFVMFFAFAQAEKEASSGPVTLEWWTWDADLKDINAKIIADFEAQNPNVTINNTIISTTEYWTKIKIQSQQNKLPDVFCMSSGYLEEWASLDLLYNLDSLIEGDESIKNFYPTLLDGGKEISGGQHYFAIPFALVTTPLFFNKDYFDAANLEYPNSDWTWDDFTKAAKKLTVDKDGDGKTDQYGFWFYGRYAHIEPWIYANDGNLINRETMLFEPDANAINALKMLVNMVVIDHSAPMPQEMSALRQQDVFPNGIAAMWVDGSWNIDNNRLTAPDTMNWGISMVPGGPDTQTPKVYGWNDFYAIAKNTKNPEMSWKFAKYVAGEGLTMDNYMAGKIPTYIPLTESEAFEDTSKLPIEISVLKDQAGSPMRTSFTKGWSEWRGYGAAESLGFNGYIDAVLNGTMTFDAAMAECPEVLNKVFMRYYQ